MNSHHLKYFYDAARTGRVNEAARLNFVTHSAISQAIRSLEEELGVPLLHHAKRRFQLSDEGMVLLERCPQFLDNLERFKEDMKKLSKEYQGELVVGAPQSLVSDSILNVFVKIQNANPKLKLKVKTGAASQIKSYLLNHQCQVGLLVDDLNLNAFDSLALQKGNFVLIAPDKKKYSKVIVTDEEKPEVKYLLEESKKTKHPLEIQMELLSWGLIRKVIEGKYPSMGYVPDYLLKNKEKKFNQIPTKFKAYQYELKLVWPKNRPLGRNAELFKNTIQEFFSGVLSK